jgi:hypothetical protein
METDRLAFLEQKGVACVRLSKRWLAARPREHNQCSALTKMREDQIAQSANRIVSRRGAAW